jgi:hypothetical protein
MATPSRAEQDSAFVRQLYERARADGIAARDEGRSVVSVRFVMVEDGDETGVGVVDLCHASLDWKTLNHVALYMGMRREGASLFSLELQSARGGYDALFSAEQFDDFKQRCSTLLRQAVTEGLDSVRAEPRACYAPPGAPHLRYLTDRRHLQAEEAAAKRKELVELRRELCDFATQAAGGGAQPVMRRQPAAPRAGRGALPNETHCEI